MRTLRSNPTPLQRFIVQECYVESERTNFLYDEDGETVYYETYERWEFVKPKFV